MQNAYICTCIKKGGTFCLWDLNLLNIFLWTYQMWYRNVKHNQIPELKAVSETLFYSWSDLPVGSVDRRLNNGLLYDTYFQVSYAIAIILKIIVQFLYHVLLTYFSEKVIICVFLLISIKEKVWLTLFHVGGGGQRNFPPSFFFNNFFLQK